MKSSKKHQKRPLRWNSRWSWWTLGVLLFAGLGWQWIGRDAAEPTLISDGFSGDIYWLSASINHVKGLDPQASSVELYLSVEGQPEASAAVTLTWLGGELGIPYQAAVTFPAGVFGRFAYSNLSADGGWSYRPGMLYTLTAVTSRGKVSASVTAPGQITHDSDGSWSRWVYEGSRDMVFVDDSNYMATFNTADRAPDADSPLRVPKEAYRQGGSFILQTRCQNVTIPVQNDLPGSSLTATDKFASRVIP